MLNSKKGNTLLKKYVTTIKESESLRKLFSLHETVSKTKNITNSSLFLNEALSIVTTKSKKDSFNEDKSKLSDIVVEALQLVNTSVDDINNALAKTTNVSESLDYLYTNKKTLKNLNEYVEKYSTVSTFINENKCESVEDSDSNMTDGKFLESFNQLASGLDSDWKKKLVENVVLNGLCGRDDSYIFEMYKTSCLEMIENTLNDCDDIETRSTFENMKHGLEKKTYIKENLTNDIIKLAELEDTLK